LPTTAADLTTHRMAGLRPLSELVEVGPIGRANLGQSVR
jgi:hypothetical protein